MTEAPTTAKQNFFGSDLLEARRLTGCKVTISEVRCEMRQPGPQAAAKGDGPAAALSFIPIVDEVQRPRAFYKIDSSGEKIAVSDDAKRFIKLDPEHKVHAMTAYGCFMTNLMEVAKIPDSIPNASDGVWGDHDWLNGLVITFEEFSPWRGITNDDGGPITIDLPSQFHAAETAENCGGAVAGAAQDAEIDEDLLKIDLSGAIASAVAANGAGGLPRKQLAVLIAAQRKRDVDPWSIGMQSRAMSYSRPEAAEAFAEILSIQGLTESNGNIVIAQPANAGEVTTPA